MHFTRLETAEVCFFYLVGMKAPDKLKIRIEPCIFEWLAWCKGILPKWLPVAELAVFGLKVDTSYEEFLKTGRLDLKEGSEAYFKRCNLLAKHIFQKYPDDGKFLQNLYLSSEFAVNYPIVCWHELICRLIVVTKLKETSTFS